MSILIGTNYAATNYVASRERVVLNSDTQSNMITMRSGQSNIGIVFDPDGNNFIVGKQSNVFMISQKGTSIASFSSNAVLIQGNTVVTNSLSSPSISSGTVYTSNVVLYPATGSLSPPYLFASNQNGVLLSATSEGNLRVGGTLRTNVLQVDGRFEATNLSVTNNFSTNRISSARNPLVYMELATDNNSNNVIIGDLNVSGTLFAGRIGYSSANVAYAFITITSNANLASVTAANTPEINGPTLQVNHTRTLGNVSRSIPMDVGINGVSALKVDSYGRLMVGTSNALAMATIQYADYSMSTSNIVYVSDSVPNSCNIVCINTSANVGVGTSTPQNRLHVVQNTADSTHTSNNALVGLYATSSISPLLEGFSNDVSVFRASANGDVACASVYSSNSVTTSSLYTSSILTPLGAENQISFGGSTLDSIDTLRTSTLSNVGNMVTSNLVVKDTLTTQNLVIPNVNIYNIMGYYGVFQPLLVFTGSNVTMSSLVNDSTNNTGKLVVRAESLTNPSTTSVGINVIGAQNSSIRVSTTASALAQPYYELLGSGTTTYISSTSTSTLSPSIAQKMFYISHNNNIGSATAADNAANAQLKILDGTGGGTSGCIVLNNMYVSGTSVGIGMGGFVEANPGYRLQVRGAFLVDRKIAGNAPILYATESASASGPIYVGVGTIMPNYELHVSGQVYSSSNLLVNANIGIGNTLPQHNLDVTGTANVTANAYVGSALGVGTQAPLLPLHVVGRAYISSNVGIGVGVTNPLYTLDVGGNVRASNVLVQSLQVTGALTATLATASSNQPNISQLSTVNINNLTINNEVLAANVSGYSTYVLNSNQPTIATMSNVTQIGFASTDIQIGNPNTTKVWATLSTPSQPNITNLATVTVANLTTTGTTIANGMTMSGALTLNTSASANVSCVATFNSNVSVRGTLFTYAGVASVSDSNIKTHLLPIANPLEKIAALTGYTYNRKDTPTTGREAGLLAQDVQKVLPELVRTSSEETCIDMNGSQTQLLTISYGNMAALFVEAIKAQQAEIDDLKALVASLYETI